MERLVLRIYSAIGNVWKWNWRICIFLPRQPYFDAVVGSMMKASKRCIPMKRQSNAKVLGWNSELKELKGNARASYGNLQVNHVVVSCLMP